MQIPFIMNHCRKNVTEQNMDFENFITWDQPYFSINFDLLKFVHYSHNPLPHDFIKLYIYIYESKYG